MKKSLVLAIVFGLLLGSGLFAQSKIVISGWSGNDQENAASQAVVDAFNASHPNIVLAWEPIAGDYVPALKTRLAGGTAADLFYLDVSVFEEFARSNALLPLDSYLKSANIDLSKFPKSLTDGFTFNSRLYGIAKDYSTLALLFNKAIFDKAGVPYPKEGATYADLRATALALKAKGIATPLIINPDFDRLVPLIRANGGKVVDANLHAAFNDPKTKASIQQYVDWFAKDKIGAEASSVGAGWEGEALGKGAVAMIMSGPWCLGYLQGSYPEVYKTLGVVQLPKGTAAQASNIYTVSWSINKATKDRAAALEVLRFLTGEGQKIFVEKAGVLGSNADIAKADTAAIKVPFYKAAQYGTAWRIATPSGLFSKAQSEISSRLKDALYGKITVDEFVKQVTANYDSWVE